MKVSSTVYSLIGLCLLFAVVYTEKLSSEIFSFLNADLHFQFGSGIWGHRICWSVRTPFVGAGVVAYSVCILGFQSPSCPGEKVKVCFTRSTAVVTGAYQHLRQWMCALCEWNVPKNVWVGIAFVVARFCSSAFVSCDGICDASLPGAWLPRVMV